MITWVNFIKIRKSVVFGRLIFGLGTANEGAVLGMIARAASPKTKGRNIKKSVK